VLRIGVLVSERGMRTTKGRGRDDGCSGYNADEEGGEESRIANRKGPRYAGDNKGCISNYHSG
jgi:hypothetical protein